MAVLRGRLTTIAAFAVVLAVSAAAWVHAEPGGVAGQQVQLLGNTSVKADPENPTNDVFQLNNGGNFGGLFREFNPGTKVPTLDNQVQLKYFFVGTKTCGVGSPRIQLGIDRDGDNQFDGNAFGYLGDKPFGGGCPPNQWVFEDMTNNQAKWDLSQFGGPMTNTWDQMEAFFAAFPTHQVLFGFLVEDPDTPVAGITYYDTLTLGNITADDRNDVARCGPPHDCNPPRRLPASST